MHTPCCWSETEKAEKRWLSCLHTMEMDYGFSPVKSVTCLTHRLPLLKAVRVDVVPTGGGAQVELLPWPRRLTRSSPAMGVLSEGVTSLFVLFPHYFVTSPGKLRLCAASKAPCTDVTPPSVDPAHVTHEAEVMGSVSYKKKKNIGFTGAHTAHMPNQDEHKHKDTYWEVFTFVRKCIFYLCSSL